MRFVILRHVCEDLHYDFMIEKGGALLTWRIMPDSFVRMLDGVAVDAERISDHRNEYLNYEGPVSGGRGRVEIFDGGEYEGSINDDALDFDLLLMGKKMRGRAIFFKRGGIYKVKYENDI